MRKYLVSVLILLAMAAGPDVVMAEAPAGGYIPITTNRDGLQLYYAYIADQSVGPFTAYEISKLEGFNRSSTSVNAAGTEEWVFAAEIKEFNNPKQPSVATDDASLKAGRAQQTQPAVPGAEAPVADKIEAPAGDNTEAPAVEPMPDFQNQDLTPEQMEQLQKVGAAGMLAALGAFIGVIVIILLVFYIVFSLSLFIIAKKLQIPNPWMAWIPIIQAFYLVMVAHRPWWWFILLFIPLVGLIIGIMLWISIAQLRGKPGWLGVLMIVPGVNLIVLLYLAFSE